MHKPTLDQLVEQEIESYLDEIAPKLYIYNSLLYSSSNGQHPAQPQARRNTCTSQTSSSRPASKVGRLWC